MSDAYRFEERNYNDPIFKNVDATYIIHLEGNGRLPHIESQLQEFHPTEKVYILYNKGYKKSIKKKHIDTPTKDLIDAFYTIFLDSREKKYNSILILEDDFIFDEKIKTKKHHTSIDKFIQNKNSIFIYYLGAITWLQTYFNQNHSRIIFSTGTHACIYSKKCIDYFLDNEEQNSINDWDIYLNFNFANRFKYYTPLCYQTFPVTENSQYWHRGSYLLYILVFIQRTIFNYLKLSNEAVLCFSVFEVESRFIFWVFIIIIIYILIYIFMRKIKPNSFNKYFKYALLN